MLAEENEGEEADGPGDLPIMGAMMIDRVSVRRAIRFNCAVVELPAKENASAAATEIKNVYEEVFGEPYVDNLKT